MRPSGDRRVWWWLWMASFALFPASCASPPGGRTIPAPYLGGPVAGGTESGRDGAAAAVPTESSPDTLVLDLLPGDAPDPACFRRATAWAKPAELLLAHPARRYDFFGLFRWEKGGPSAAQVASSEIQRRLGLDGIDLDRSEVHLRKDYGRRLSLVTTTGLGAEAEDALEANYRLYRSWYVRSETRERGETFMELRREISFW